MTIYTGMSYGDTSTLQGIREDIYFLGHVNASTISNNDLLRIVNKYYGQLQEAVRSVNENFFMGIATADLVIGDGSYSFPDGTGTAPPYEKIKSIWVAYQPVDKTTPLASEYKRCDIIDPDSISDPAFDFSAESPKAQIFGNYFVLEPLVTDVTKYPVTDGVKMFYITRQNILSVDTDVPKIFPSFHDAITQGALIDIAKRTGDEKLQADSIKEFAKRIEDIKDYASAHIPEELGIIEGQDTLGGWAFPFGFNSMS